MKRPLKNLTAEAVRGRAAAWLHERIDLEPMLHWMAKKTVPGHRQSWIYLLGGAAMFLFALQLASGCLLMLYYQPAESCAHQSVRRIMLEVPYGWLVRSMHVWGANLFIAVAGLHFLSVLFTRAYRRPRELTWVSGMAMLLLALGFGFSGYLLPWNELAYYATLVGTEDPRRRAWDRRSGGAPSAGRRASDRRHDHPLLRRPRDDLAGLLRTDPAGATCS